MPTIPTTMRAAAIDKFGGPEVLKLQTLPVPIPVKTFCDTLPNTNFPRAV